MRSSQPSYRYLVRLVSQARGVDSHTFCHRASHVSALTPQAAPILCTPRTSYIIQSNQHTRACCTGESMIQRESSLHVISPFQGLRFVEMTF